MEISLTKTLERKKKNKFREEQIGEGPFSTIQLVSVNLYTKFEVSILNGCGDIFNAKSGEKEKKNIGKNKQENVHFQSDGTICRCEPVYQV